MTAVDLLVRVFWLGVGLMALGVIAWVVSLVLAPKTRTRGVDKPSLAQQILNMIKNAHKILVDRRKPIDTRVAALGTLLFMAGLFLFIVGLIPGIIGGQGAAPGDPSVSPSTPSATPT